MSRAAARLDRWIFAAAPAERLGVLRVLAAGFALGYLLVRLPVFLALADGDPARLEPVGVLAPLTSPLPGPLVVALLVATLALGAAVTLGWHHRWTGPLFGVGLLVLTTYRSSFGQLLHFENLMVLQVLVVGCTRAADAWSLDARRRRSVPGPSPDYGWPVRLAALVTVATYVLAGVAKLRIGGLDWVMGDTLRNHVAYAAARLDLLGGTPSPVARLVVDHAWAFPPLAAATVLIELSAPVALLGGRVRDTWVASAWLLHAGVAALMLIVFPSPLLLVAFAPLYHLEHLPRAWDGGFAEGGRRRKGPERAWQAEAVTPEQDDYLRNHGWALLTTTRGDGSPQVSMVAYHFDGTDIVVSCLATSAKFANARRRPAVVVAVPDGRRYLAVQGRAEALATGPERDRLTGRVRDALEPQDAAILDAAFAQGLDAAGRVVLRVVPERVLGRI